MPKLTVPGEGTFEVEKGKRLVLALEDNGIDVSHRCGGYAKCTTCRCNISDGIPEKVTKAGKERIEAAIEKGDDDIKGQHLSCQTVVNEDMTVVPTMRVRDSDWDDPGKRPEDHITPEPEWVALPTFMT